MTTRIDCGRDRLYNPATGKCVKADGSVGKKLLKDGKGRRFGECAGAVVSDAKGVPYCSKKTETAKKSEATAKKTETAKKKKAQVDKARTLATERALATKIRLIRHTLRDRDATIVQLQRALASCRADRNDEKRQPASRLSQKNVNQLLRLVGASVSKPAMPPPPPPARR